MPDDKNTIPLFRMYAVLLIALGAAVTADDVHNAWVCWMLAEDPGHPALVPYSQLPRSVAAQDDDYVAAIRAVASKVANQER